MTKTQHYNLNKPEAGDPIRVADFNQNADIIDAALAAKGNCKIEVGSYAGNGEYDYGTNITVKFSKKPLVVFIGGAGYTAVLIGENSNCISVDPNGSVRVIYPTWGSDGTVSWYSSSNAGYQMNTKNATYTYFALLD